jgi:Uma2 family endonuclease
MLQTDLKYLPSSSELPDSDDTPVDNEDQNYIPNLLLFLLEYLWKERNDWFFGADMGIYHATGLNPRNPIVPDAFLSLGVERRKEGKSRGSYVVWEERNNQVPILTIEVVSQTAGGEYEQKLAIYAKLGVLYYLIYNPRFWRRDGHLPFELYKLTNGIYQLQTSDRASESYSSEAYSSESYWLPEIGLGIGSCVLPTDRFQREVLSWFDRNGNRYLSEAEQERVRVEYLAKYLRSLGIDPDNLPLKS